MNFECMANEGIGSLPHIIMHKNRKVWGADPLYLLSFPIPILGITTSLFPSHLRSNRGRKGNIDIFKDPRAINRTKL